MGVSMMYWWPRLISSVFSYGNFWKGILCGVVLILGLRIVTRDAENANHRAVRLCLALLFIRFVFPVTFPWEVSVYSTFLGKITAPFRNIVTWGGMASVLDVLLLVWLIGTVVSGIVLLRRILLFYRVLKHHYVARSEKNKAVFSWMDRKFGAAYRIAVLPGTSTPAICGIRMPVLIISPQWNCSEEEWNLILEHEAAHFMSRHTWITMLLAVFSVTQWWNPLIKSLKKNFDYLMEIDADNRVIRHESMMERLKYASLLVKTKKQLMYTKSKAMGVRNPISVPFFSKGSLIGARVKNITRERKKESRKHCLGRTVLSVGMLAFAFSVYVVTIEPDYLPESIRHQEMADTTGTIITEDNSYLVECGEGYELYVNGSLFFSFSSKQKVPKELLCLPKKTNDRISGSE